MGYYTNYRLHLLSLETKAETFYGAEAELYLIKNDLIKYMERDTGEQKWYDHEKNMLAHSEALPDFILKLSGEGEENEDIWEKYFYRGKVETCKAIVKIPKPNWNNLGLKK